MNTQNKKLAAAWQREIGAKIREARKARHLSQAELAMITGIEQPNISQIERGSYSITIGRLGLICSALGMTINISPPSIPPPDPS